MNGENGEQEKWAAATLELSSRLAMLYHGYISHGLSAHYVDRRSHPRAAADSTSVLTS